MRGLVLLAWISSARAFAPAAKPAHLPPTAAGLEPEAENKAAAATMSTRREALGYAFGLASSAALLPAGGAVAASNPALETFKGKSKSQSFYPVRACCLLSPFPPPLPALVLLSRSALTGPPRFFELQKFFCFLARAGKGNEGPR
jgi:hypothetical protein